MIIPVRDDRSKPELDSRLRTSAPARRQKHAISCLEPVGGPY